MYVIFCFTVLQELDSSDREHAKILVNPCEGLQVLGDLAPAVERTWHM